MHGSESGVGGGEVEVYNSCVCVLISDHAFQHVVPLTGLQ